MAAMAPHSEPANELCWFGHEFTPWKTEEVAEGNGWERKVRKEQWRECKKCYLTQFRAV